MRIAIRVWDIVFGLIMNNVIVMPSGICVGIKYIPFTVKANLEF